MKFFKKDHHGRREWILKSTGIEEFLEVFEHFGSLVSSDYRVARIRTIMGEHKNWIARKEAEEVNAMQCK